jgi:hypothetical protein
MLKTKIIPLNVEAERPREETHDEEVPVRPTYRLTSPINHNRLAAEGMESLDTG